jgi:hypothetical protein
MTERSKLKGIRDDQSNQINTFVDFDQNGSVITDLTANWSNALTDPSHQFPSQRGQLIKVYTICTN